ncbi:hypothetical protein T229_03480 [Tannerella sp. oral taxon BU063 isolate Cell 5]|uniref:Uncharacterized protein n=1 Tax=Tannerella sp. oral taxon BU063 isolate Cell 5 TaxID=1410950 RepID=W2CEF4_9BACT|nr:hypothetical protein T229_03480 [Tannerella sp. oral taxon BU063 isolate Cell 5]
MRLLLHKKYPSKAHRFALLFPSEQALHLEPVLLFLKQ